MVRRSPPRSSVVHPVSSYRKIAISFLFITVVLVVLVVSISTKRATIMIETREEPKTVEGAVTFVAREGNGGIPALITSTDVIVTANVVPTGSKDTVGKSRGSVVLINSGTTPQSLIVKTRVQTDSGLVYRLDTAARVPAKGRVEVPVTADGEGGVYDIGPARFTIPGLSSARQAVVYAESMNPMAGGVIRLGAVGEEDIMQARALLRERGLALASAQFGEIKEGGQREMLVEKEEMVFGAALGESVSLLTATATIRVVQVAFTKEKLRGASLELLAKQASADTTMLVPENDLPEIALKECSVSEGTCRGTMHIDGTLRVNPESAVLQPKNFIGKTKDEVRKQIQTIPLVSWVQVTLTPSWLSTVPQFADNITIQITEAKKP